MEEHIVKSQPLLKHIVKSSNCSKGYVLLRKWLFIVPILTPKYIFQLQNLYLREFQSLSFIGAM